MRIERTITHGIACSVYFFDPEDNRIELYYTTPYKVRQPLGEKIDLDRPDAELLALAQSFEGTLGPPRGAQQRVVLRINILRRPRPPGVVRVGDES
jgi:hypothetical protein